MTHATETDDVAVRPSTSKTAVSYVRVSTKEQAERDGDPDGYSIPAQKAANARKAEWG
ncbi:putative recombinase, partial [Gordonia aichiensis NBRC 108223]